MNFRDIPLSESPAGFWIVFAGTFVLMAAIAAVWKWSTRLR